MSETSEEYVDASERPVTPYGGGGEGASAGAGGERGRAHGPPGRSTGGIMFRQGAVMVVAAVFGCASYANLSDLVTESADYRFFPPFKAGVNANRNNHLGGENLEIAKSLAAGRGFSDPFGRPTGPTAWMPPALPSILAGLWWVSGHDKAAVTSAIIVLQQLVLIGTGFLVLALFRGTAARLRAGSAVVVFVLGLVFHFRLCFQLTHDCWLVLLNVELLIAGYCWARPLRSTWTALGWGAFGGLCALVSPVVGVTWGVLSGVAAWRASVWSRSAVALVAAGLALAPWVGRNYLVFGRLIPVKSNLAFELYQSQCLQPDGVVQATTFDTHPYIGATSERQEYERLGEVAFLDRKQEQFWDTVRADPWDFLRRVVQRGLAATLVYVPYNRGTEPNRPVALWFRRLTHPLPFLGLIFLVGSAARQPLHPSQWGVITVYLTYLAPYVAVSYYERYALPLLGVKVLLVLWGADRFMTWYVLPMSRRLFTVFSRGIPAA